MPPPRATAFGSLTHYMTHADPRNFQPANITFDLLPPLDKRSATVRSGIGCSANWRSQQFDEWLENRVYAGSSLALES